MKKLILLILLSISFFYSKGQEINQLNEMVNESLMTYLDNIDKLGKEVLNDNNYLENMYIVLDVYRFGCISSKFFI